MDNIDETTEGGKKKLNVLGAQVDYTITKIIWWATLLEWIVEQREGGNGQ